MICFFWLCDIPFMCFFSLFFFLFILLSFYPFIFYSFILYPFIRLSVFLLFFFFLYPFSFICFMGVWGFTPISTAGAYLGDWTPSEKMVYI